jgi:acetyl-CoA carboxylase biotin carboxyl carrier protein
VSLDLDEIRELLVALNQTDIAELTIKSGDFELMVRRGLTTVLSHTSLPNGEPTAPLVVPTSLPTASPVALPSEAIPPPASAKSERRLAEITSPMVGTFYRSPSPDDAPFVDTGDRIQAGQTVCIIEAKKLMNEIEAEISGEIVEILVQNAQPVEYGQVLMRVNPTGG